MKTLKQLWEEFNPYQAYKMESIKDDEYDYDCPNLTKWLDKRNKLISNMARAKAKDKKDRLIKLLLLRDMLKYESYFGYSSIEANIKEFRAIVNQMVDRERRSCGQ